VCNSVCKLVITNVTTVWNFWGCAWHC